MQSVEPKASVLIITYNHEKFIEQAVESVLSQETSFPFEVHVIEDCSKDQTRLVLQKIAERHPGKLHLHFNEKNLGAVQPVLHKGYHYLKGDYVAILEGDDYWGSPLKLQKQVEFLENNSDYVACGHNTIKMYDDNSQPPHRFHEWGMKESQTIFDFLAMTSFYHQSSVLYRNVFKKKRPDPHFANRFSCEIYVNMSFARYGKFHYMKEDWSIYRAHAAGNFSTMTEWKSRIYTMECLIRANPALGYGYLQELAYTIHRSCRELFHETEGHNWPLTAEETKRFKDAQLIYGAVYERMEQKLPADWTFNYNDKLSPQQKREVSKLIRANKLGVLKQWFMPRRSPSAIKPKVATQ